VLFFSPQGWSLGGGAQLPCGHHLPRGTFTKWTPHRGRTADVPGTHCNRNVYSADLRSANPHNRGQQQIGEAHSRGGLQDCGRQPSAGAWRSSWKASGKAWRGEAMRDCAQHCGRHGGTKSYELMRTMSGMLESFPVPSPSRSNR